MVSGLALGKGRLANVACQLGGTGYVILVVFIFIHFEKSWVSNYMLFDDDGWCKHRVGVYFPTVINMLRRIYAQVD